MARTKKPAAAPARKKASTFQDDRAVGTATQPSLRTTVQWNPAQVRSVQASAEAGSLLRVADLCDCMIADDRILELLVTRSGNLLGSELSFLSSLHAKEPEPARYAGELEEDFWEAFPEDQCTQLIIWGLTLGVSFGRLAPWRDAGETGRIIPTMEFWHPKHFKYDWKIKQWVLILENQVEHPITEGDGTWIVYTPYGRYRPWAHGLWRGLADWWMLKRYAISDWGVHTEKSSKHVLTADEHATAEARKAVAADIFEMYRDAIIALPQGFDLKLVELSANTREIYNSQIEAANEGAAIAILGQNLTTKVEGGSYAAAQTHAGVELKRTKSDNNTFSTTMRQQAITWWAEYNFGDRRQAPWPMYDVEPPEDKVQNATTLSTVADAIGKLQSAGYKLLPEVIRERYGVEIEPMTAAEKKALLPPAPPAPKPGEPAPPGPQQPKPPPPRKVAQAGLDTDPQLAAKKGFLHGQLYADDVADLAVEEGAAELEPFIGKLQKVIADAKDYESMRAAVLKLYRAERPSENFAQVLEHALVMTNLGGRLAVDEDR